MQRKLRDGRHQYEVCAAGLRCQPPAEFAEHDRLADDRFTDREVAVIKEDDGAVTSVSGIDDRAAQGAVKEFAAESDGYVVVASTPAASPPPGRSWKSSR